MNIPTPQTIDLGGHWSLRDAQSEFRLAATVPGCVHTDLFAAGTIPDLWYRDNEKDIQWVARRDWIYERDFEVGAEFLARDHAVLRFEGLDTLCSVELNGATVLEADNMHRTWEVDVKRHLRAGSNTLRLTFHSPLPLMKRRDAEIRLPGWSIYHEDFRGKSYLRKMACAFGWDWGPMAPTAGIWRPASLIGFDARIEDVRLAQQHRDGEVRLRCDARITGDGKIRHRLWFDGKPVAEATARNGSAEFVVPEPQLWWPNGMGAQPLYNLVTELIDAHGCILDSNTKRIGLRTCELVREPDAFGESFRFRVNGRDVFIKGANWIPCDIFPSRVEAGTYRHLLESSARAHMNMIRVWGGGIYEHETFYDLCDELGLLVWQDFMFACSAYPGFDDNFVANVAAEARDNVRRLRHRACLALWCGNNEIEQGLVKWEDGPYDHAMPQGDYKRIFDELLSRVVAEEDAIAPYWPCSPHTPGANRREFNDPTCGDAHAWSVWFGGAPIEAQRAWGYRFMSEFGFQSYPELRTVESYTAPDERNLINWVMDYHQRSGPGNQTILKYALEWFREARDFESSLIVSQLVQALCIQYAAEHARRIQGRMDGLMYWQVNDLWPGATWSSIDVYGRWKALHYFARRFFAPVLVSLLEDGDRGTVEVHVSNQRAQAFRGVVRWFVTDCAGAVLREGALAADVASQSNARLAVIDCTDLRTAGGTARLPLEIRTHRNIPMAGDRDLLVWAVVEEDGRELSRNLAFFAKPKYWKLRDPQIEATVCEADGRIFIDLRARHCAPWTRLSIAGADAVFSDNYIHLAPHLPLRVELESCSITDVVQIRHRLRIRPLASL